jgi:hypothetical protein
VDPRGRPFPIPWAAGTLLVAALVAALTWHAAAPPDAEAVMAAFEREHGFRPADVQELIRCREPAARSFRVGHWIMTPGSFWPGEAEALVAVLDADGRLGWINSGSVLGSRVVAVSGERVVLECGKTFLMTGPSSHLVARPATSFARLRRMLGGSRSPPP